MRARRASRPTPSSTRAPRHRDSSPPCTSIWSASWKRPRGRLQDYELTRLALLAGAAEVLARSAAGALRYLERGFDYRRAADLAKQATALLDAAGIEVPLPLLRTAADRLQAVGDVGPAEALRQRALQAIEKGVAAESFDHCALALDHARALVARGELDAALPFFKQARALASSERDRTVVLGNIADILQRARASSTRRCASAREEELPVYERLGDVRAKAVTMGKIADILQARGQLDEALRIRTEEELPVYERLGDVRSKAVTMGKIADILQARGRARRGAAHPHAKNSSRSTSAWATCASGRSRSRRSGWG